jgi:hypothetical protein
LQHWRLAERNGRKRWLQQKEELKATSYMPSVGGRFVFGTCKWRVWSGTTVRFL